ncbi:M20/M25/M40 family metallo-hydrolase [Companilactobacillus insicii]|uniref:M20/M25/M40 family metallo-hydrolase n=1 Tax=Companilactobacillus insicii TaxID=1732567 RepID=UPI000F779344|nr:M20/M25/M40 family metallo-hydrolase [Companilactobacillus insicii]
MKSRDKFIDEHKNKFELLFKNLINLKGISETGEGIAETVAFLKDTLQRLLGAKVQIIETKGSPTILAEMSGQSSQTILFYGHYDVMTPGDIRTWKSDPFQLTKRDHRFFGRGAGDNKGQLLAQILGMYTYLQVNGSFPFNIKLLIEGEEEQGSKNLPITVKKLADKELQDVDTAIVIDGSFNQAGHVLRLGNRGALGFEISVTTGNQDNHSGNLGNIMDNPVLILIELLNKMYDSEKQRVLIPHFYDDIQEPNSIEKKWMQDLPYDKAAISKQTGIKNLPVEKLDYYQKLMFEPTFNISGINSGYSGEGMKTIIPNHAVCKVDCRLVGHQNLKVIKSEIDKIIAEFPNDVVKIRYLVQVPASKTNSDNKEIGPIVKSIKEATGSKLIEPVMPGTVPNFVWSDILKVPVFTIPYANFDQHNHAPNENLTEDAFYEGIKISYELINNL